MTLGRHPQEVAPLLGDVRDPQVGFHGGTGRCGQVGGLSWFIVGSEASRIS